MIRMLKVTLVLLGASWIGTSQGESRKTPQKLPAEVNLYTTRHYDADRILAKSFEAATGIKVNTVQIKEASQLLARAIEEKDAPKADLIVTADIGNLARAAAAGVLAPLKSSIIRDAVPEHFRDTESMWTGLAMRARVIAYDPLKVTEDSISRIEDLANPKFVGRVLVRSSSHVYNQSLAATLLAANGPEGLRTWARGITKNLARKPQGGDTDQVKALAAGEGDLAIINSYYAARLLASNDPKDKALMENVRIKFPNQKDRGAHANLSVGGITARAKNPENAIRFLEYLVSEDAQKIFVSETMEYPVRQGVEPHPILKSFGTPKFDLSGLKRIAKESPEALRILEEVGWR